MSSKIDLGAPVRVSPLIKFCRYTALIGGIAWGVHRYRVNKRKEDAHRAYVEKMKPEWDAILLKKKKTQEREGLLQIAKDTGIPIPKDFDQRYPPQQ